MMIWTEHAKVRLKERYGIEWNDDIDYQVDKAFRSNSISLARKITQGEFNDFYERSNEYILVVNGQIIRMRVVGKQIRTCVPLHMKPQNVRPHNKVKKRRFYFEGEDD